MVCVVTEVGDPVSLNGKAKAEMEAVILQLLQWQEAERDSETQA